MTKKEFVLFLNLKYSSFYFIVFLFFQTAPQNILFQFSQ